MTYDADTTHDVLRDRLRSGQTARIACAQSVEQIRMHLALLAQEDLGVIELRVFDPYPKVAYAESVGNAIGLCMEMDGRASGIYVGVQMRPAHLFDLAPNRWVRAGGRTEGNCARDRDIEYITTGYWDLDVVSPQRQEGHPASDEELEQTLQAAKQLIRQDGLGLEGVICCSGNGHYVVAPIVPITVDNDEVAAKFKSVCQQLAQGIAGQFPGVRIDPVYNLSRVMRVMGTWNRKGRPLPDRPYRRAFFVSELLPLQSMALHHMILNADAGLRTEDVRSLPAGLKCDLARIERCQFIQWCRRHAMAVTEPHWFALITNLARLDGGIALIHEISALDPERYDREQTQRVIERALREGYRPVNCRTIMDQAVICPGRGVFHCSRIERCRARAPMYMAALQPER